MKPDLNRYRPDPAYLRELIAASGKTQEEVADALGVGRRAMRYYLSTAKDHRDAPYLVQYAIEGLAPTSVLARLQATSVEKCLDCDGSGKYPSGQTCKSCEGRGHVPIGSNS